MASALQPAEIGFAQRLACNEKVLRDRAVKRLRKYITVKTTQRTGGFSPEELLKIWKGLFYCMWMQDKPLLQEALADTISQLLHAFRNRQAQRTFIQTFWQTMSREWNGIDRLRLDKYYLLSRRMMRQTLEVLKRNAWDGSLAEEFLNLLTEEVLHGESKAPNGIRFHLIDIYLEELARVGAEELVASQNLQLIEPFCKIAAETKDPFLMQAIARGIFETIVDQAPFAIEDLMNELKTSRGDVEENEEKILSKKPSPRQLKAKENKGLFIEDGLEAGEEGDEKDSCESIGPVLQFDYKAVADRLFELASGKSTPAQNRKRLYKLVKRFQDLAEGIFPQDDFPEDVSTDEDDRFSSRRFMKKANKVSKKIKAELKRGKDQGEKEKKSSNVEVEAASGVRLKKKKKRKREPKSGGPETAAVQGSLDSSRNTCELEAGKRRKSTGASLEACESTKTKAPGGGQEGSSCCPEDLPITRTQNKQKRCKGKRIEVNAESTEMQFGNVSKSSEVPGGSAAASVATEMRKERAASPGNGNGSLATVSRSLVKPTEAEAPVPVTLKRKGKQRMVPTRAESLLRKGKKRKIKKALSCGERSTALETVSKKSKINKEDGEFVRFGKIASPRPLFCKTPQGGLASFRTAKRAKKRGSCGSKRVTFGFNRNTTAEFKTTDKSILVSPEGASRVAFHPDHKPGHGVLKSPPSNEPRTKSLRSPVKRRSTAQDFF
ncbi:ribosomal RNA processing protein 1 homolog A-like [Rhinatrema bivittatum]|uniref:ribosomal RNA processing protein 1 homolog A-like n=1 Tax=Rhinatrema bivittatum TaxID=194408 RepID=UPI00112B7F2C|nr:ribosomal RNA processing protein 1 homolog A-like [Rhinatrema bivittatum]